MKTQIIPVGKIVYATGFQVGKHKQPTMEDICLKKNKKHNWHGMRGVKSWHRCSLCRTQELINI